MSKNERAPAAGNGRGAENANQGASKHKHSTPSRRTAPAGDPIDRLLDRLDHVRQTGDRWRARCPSHGSDRNQSLSITAADDGTVLLKCFGGCGAADVMAAAGLTLADLFPERPQENRTPRTAAERRMARERARMYAIRRLLPELALEVRIVLAAAAVIGNGERLNLTDEDRLVEAVERIEQAREVLR